MNKLYIYKHGSLSVAGWVQYGHEEFRDRGAGSKIVETCSGSLEFCAVFITIRNCSLWHVPWLWKSSGMMLLWSMKTTLKISNQLSWELEVEALKPRLYEAESGGLEASYTISLQRTNVQRTKLRAEDNRKSHTNFVQDTAVSGFTIVEHPTIWRM